MTIAKNNNIKKEEAIIVEINSIVKSWSDFAAHVKVPKKLHQLVESNLHTL